MNRQGGRNFNNHHNNYRGGGRGGRRGYRNANSRSFTSHRNNKYNGRGNDDAFHMIESSGSPSDTSFTVAVQGCSHGELDSIYDALETYRAGKLSKQIDVLLCCGDAQTLRNNGDFHSLNVPEKYKKMGDFHAYYSGQKVAPILTIIVGGNHEASNFLQELYYGGWVAPNIYYLGAAGVINICKKTSSSGISSLRIGGLSGIYSHHHYKLGRFETPPFGQSELRSVYHTREVEVKRLEALASTSKKAQPIDVFISHDWPRGVYHHGNVNQLLKMKPFFKKEVHENSLGSPASEQLLHLLRPRYWFSAHLHVKFSADVRHESMDEVKDGDSSDEQDTATKFHGMESNDGNCPISNSNVQSLTEQMTKFLSLDKCLPKRRHIQILHVEPSITSRSSVKKVCEGVESNKPWLEYDLQWLSILKMTHHWTQRTRNRVNLVNEAVSLTKEQIDQLEYLLRAASLDKNVANPFAIPLNFSMTVHPFDPSSPNQHCNAPPQLGNPQTDQLLLMLGLDHRITIPYDSKDVLLEKNLAQSSLTSLRPSQVRVNAQRASDDANEIDLDDDSAEDIKALGDPCEIDIDYEDDNEEDVSSKPKKPKI